ncbi:MAG: hypothetical protein JST42_00895 [Bacteroidetes bacterium]|nr:hypothetical protein [Bacteroidota bacterium]
MIEYHLWAHKRVLEQLRDLSIEEWSRNTGGSFASLRALYQHLLESDYRWLWRWKGVPFADILPEFVVEGYGSLERLWLPQLEEMRVVVGEFVGTDAARPVHFVTGKGLHVTQPWWQTLYQVVNHGTYHRGQVTNALRILGGQPVSTDIFLFFKEKEG